MSKHGPVRILTREEIAEASSSITKPLTQKEIAAREASANLRPDTSHLTVWDPSKRR